MRPQNFLRFKTVRAHSRPQKNSRVRFQKNRPPMRQQDLEALYPGWGSGDTDNSEWAFKRDTQRFMVAWVAERPHWPG